MQVNLSKETLEDLLSYIICAKVVVNEGHKNMLFSHEEYNERIERVNELEAMLREFLDEN